MRKQSRRLQNTCLVALIVFISIIFCLQLACINSAIPASRPHKLIGKWQLVGTKAVLILNPDGTGYFKGQADRSRTFYWGVAGTVIRHRSFDDPPIGFSEWHYELSNNDERLRTWRDSRFVRSYERVRKVEGNDRE